MLLNRVLLLLTIYIKYKQHIIKTVYCKPIGSYAGDFTLEHTVKINSIPANGNTDKNSAAGFFVNLWLISKQEAVGILQKKSDTELNVAWKNTRASSVRFNNQAWRNIYFPLQLYKCRQRKRCDCYANYPYIHRVTQLYQQVDLI